MFVWVWGFSRRVVSTRPVPLLTFSKWTCLVKRVFLATEQRVTQKKQKIMFFFFKKNMSFEIGIFLRNIGLQIRYISEKEKFEKRDKNEKI